VWWGQCERVKFLCFSQKVVPTTKTNFVKIEDVEASFMMINQVDSRCFDDNKRWWKKSQRMISRLSQQVQDQD